VFVPYKGAAARAVTDLLAGQTQMTIEGATTPSCPHVTAGKVRALAVTSVTRIAEIADVPTMLEWRLPRISAVVVDPACWRRRAPQPFVV